MIMPGSSHAARRTDATQSRPYPIAGYVVTRSRPYPCQVLAVSGWRLAVGSTVKQRETGNRMGTWVLR